VGSLLCCRTSPVWGHAFLAELLAATSCPIRTKCRHVLLLLMMMIHIPDPQLDVPVVTT